MQISKNNCRIHLTGHHGDCCPGSAIIIDMEDLKIYQQSILAKEYKHSRPGYEKTEWDNLEMNIADPFGSKITFSERLRKVSA